MKTAPLTATLLIAAALLTGCSNSADDKTPAPKPSDSSSSPAETAQPEQPSETTTEATPEAPSTLPQTLTPKPGESPTAISDVPVQHHDS